MVSGTLLRETDEIARIRAALGNKVAAVFDRMPAHTPRQAVVDAAAMARAAGADLIVTVGGGSVTDAAKAVHVAPALKAYLVDLASASRRHPHLALGMSPRATLALQKVARARAAANGRSYVVPDDLKALAEPVLAHRLLVTPEAQLQGISAADALTEVLRAVPVPAGKAR